MRRSAGAPPEEKARRVVGAGVWMGAVGGQRGVMAAGGDMMTSVQQRDDSHVAPGESTVWGAVRQDLLDLAEPHSEETAPIEPPKLPNAPLPAASSLPGP